MTAQTKSELLPFIPLLVGQGKLARHLSFYLSQKNIPFEHWLDGRKLHDPNLKPILERVNCVWILVADRAIKELSTKLRELAPALPQMHSSAASEIPGTLTLHPLQTFGLELYPLSTYEAIPFTFVREEWATEPELKQSIETNFSNPRFEISKAKRALYHSYCVMMANFPQLLWSAVLGEAENSIHSTRALFTPILKQATENFLSQGEAAVTGPLVRGDLMTIQRHENALSHSRLLSLYQNFVSIFKPSQNASAKELS
jgi:hypothetical protein